MSKSGDLDHLAAGGEALAERAKGEPARRIDRAKVGDVVELVEVPTVRGSDGKWKRAPSKRAEVVYHIEGSPFVRFLVGAKKTHACWVGCATLIAG